MLRCCVDRLPTSPAARYRGDGGGGGQQGNAHAYLYAHPEYRRHGFHRYQGDHGGNAKPNFQCGPCANPNTGVYIHSGTFPYARTHPNPGADVHSHTASGPNAYSHVDAGADSYTNT